MKSKSCSNGSRAFFQRGLLDPHHAARGQLGIQEERVLASGQQPEVVLEVATLYRDQKVRQPTGLDLAEHVLGEAGAVDLDEGMPELLRQVTLRVEVDQ